MLPGSLKWPSRPGRPNRLVVVTVGLPARGKTLVSHKISRYLVWLGHGTRVFNVGQYRRQQELALRGSYLGADLFDPANTGGVQEREHAASQCLEDMIDWLKADGKVAIFDATNGTKERRKLITERCHKEKFQVLFIESTCFIPEIIAANIHLTQVNAPEYEGMSPEEAAADFARRCEFYKREFQALDDDADRELSYIKFIDVGRKIVVNHLRGYLPGRIVGLLMNVHISPHVIYLTRHGQSEYNAEARLGGDSSLSKAGRRYARRLASFMKQEVKRSEPLSVWTSTLLRTIQTAAPLKRNVMQWRALNEIDAGVCNGMTYNEIEEKYPGRHKERSADKLRWRYPRGESYLDVVGRLEPIFINGERQTAPILVIAHQAILKVLACYFGDKSPQDVPDFPVRRHSVLKLTLHSYGCQAEVFELMPAIRSEPVHPLDR